MPHGYTINSGCFHTQKKKHQLLRGCWNSPTQSDHNALSAIMKTDLSSATIKILKFWIVQLLSKRVSLALLKYLQQRAAGTARASENNCVYTSIKTFMSPAQPAGKGLIAWSAFLSVDCACSNRCLIMEQECGGNGGDKPEPL